jgi:hypothetical protein
LKICADICAALIIRLEARARRNVRFCADFFQARRLFFKNLRVPLSEDPAQGPTFGQP